MEIEKQKRILAIIVAPFVMLWYIGRAIHGVLAEIGADVYYFSYNALWGPKKSKLKNPHV